MIMGDPRKKSPLIHIVFCYLYTLVLGFVHPDLCLENPLAMSIGTNLARSVSLE